MKTGNIRWGSAVVAGLLATVVGFLVGFILYSSVNGVYESFGDLPYAKPVESIPIYLSQMVVGGGALTVLSALVYAAIQEALPGQKKWQKGLAFGLTLSLVCGILLPDVWRAAHDQSTATTHRGRPPASPLEAFSPTFGHPSKGLFLHHTRRKKICLTH
ncbi:MAG: hypothetical protein ISS49_14455 [Anaerolineae bacterium]|nr:hypothetical protein [Anaerolineae bacterium]